MIRLLILSTLFALACCYAVNTDKLDYGSIDESYDILSPFGMPDGLDRRHGHHHGHFPFYPPFLRNVSSSARREFFKIVFDPKATKGEIKKRVGEWAVKNHVEDQVKAWHEKIVAYFTDHHKNVTAAIGKLQGAYDSLTSIIKDDSLTRHQSYVKIHDLFVASSRELRALLFATRPIPPRRRPHEKEDGDEDEFPSDGSFQIPGLKFQGVGPVQVDTNRVN